MVDVAQLVSASDCGSEGRGFESPHPPHFLMYRSSKEERVHYLARGLLIMGCRQAVRHQTLTLAFAGSNPASPAKYDSLAQLVEQRPFKAKVRGSSPRRVTKIRTQHPLCPYFYASGTRTPTERHHTCGSLSFLIQYLYLIHESVWRGIYGCQREFNMDSGSASF